VDGKLVTAACSVSDVLPPLLERMNVPDAEIVTVYYGEDVDEEQASQIVDELEQTCEDAEIELLDGGQAHYWYIISAE